MAAGFVQRTHRFITQHQMIQPRETVLVGVSGGVDSLALLYALHTLRHQLDCQLHVAHLDHGFREDSAGDAVYVAEQADQLGIPISSIRIDVPQLMWDQKLSAEVAARQARYQFYECISKRIGATKIALGHHRGDQAETVLMNLLRGAGASGLKGILPVREGKFIRPLLAFSRKEIEDFVAQLGLQPRCDATNYQLNYLRNRVRLELIPALERAYNPNIQSVLNQTAELLQVESDYLEMIAHDAFQACRIESYTPDTVVLDRRLFRQHHLALRRRILRLAVAEVFGEIRDLYFNHFESMLNLIDGEAPNSALDLPNGGAFRRAYNRVLIQKAADSHPPFEYEVAVPGHTPLPRLDAEMIATVVEHPINCAVADKFPDGKFQAVFDLDRLQLPLMLRQRRDGDRFHPFGMRGTKKLKDLLIDTKIPRQKRGRIPVLMSGDEIIWVVGYRTSEPFKIRAETRRRLYLSYSPSTKIDENGN
ncbi:tRNA lysidine(34) synthetase TilS [Candidatus Poribacteria bacterium]|nr:tRNA lysidine(34) synthetase TilS [Candidatus Poribacteria bacterium]